MNEKVIIELIMQLLGCQCNGCTLRSVFVHAIEMFISLCMRFELMQTWMLYNNISFFVFLLAFQTIQFSMDFEIHSSARIIVEIYLCFSLLRESQQSTDAHTLTHTNCDWRVSRYGFV